MNAHDDWAVLQQLFGDNRAEWPQADFGDLFVEPPYLKKLESMRPCFLVGGRGTGKTTTLQSLRYDATLRRLEGSGLSFSDQSYLGILVRMNKNRVRAFQGSQLPEQEWGRLFGHYVNLLVCLELAGLAQWLEARTEARLTKSHFVRIGDDLGIDEVGSIDELEAQIRRGIARLQIYVNNPSPKNSVTVSIAEAPLRTTVEVLSDAGFLSGQIVFCCFDEYENLLDYQQSVLNTYIKHASPPLSYKVGVRKNGLRSHHTLDGSDVINNPDDYAEIEIAEEGFEYFASRVAQLRLEHARRKGIRVPETLRDFLAELSLHDEAALLGAGEIAAGVMREIRASGEHEVLELFAQKPDFEVCFLRYWESTGEGNLLSLGRDWKKFPEKWDTRLGNYGFASLFWLSVGRKGARIRKYYCGERVLLTLAGGNIRYFLDLLHTSISEQLSRTEDSSERLEAPLMLSAQSQTHAAREVGRRRLDQLEGIADHGPQLKRLVLAVGKVFFERTRASTRGTPEQNSFVLTGDGDDVARLVALLSEGVAHLAFEVEARTKATSSLEIRDGEYRLHRIFSAFFEISHRKKRRMTFDASQLLAVLGDKPARAIAALLDGQGQSSESSLPEQLAFFSGFYGEEQ